ncbi:N-acyl-D-amino-acid deacylase family protein [Microbulbifer agarilyticus]|uniref:N-acyl-D-amino-acid deacylase family protein n=1 Tax=Microbulbifer agarilyticus TaxID=260552 RepID=UPI001CD6CF73|nr:N-acyl-D-glutamate amidohydrolase [Microbulbifer agarilyticus]MCA0900750.1 N-acyl-D-glutamate amidohydrolase [Microbulbifer agarilyticus]
MYDIIIKNGTYFDGSKAKEKLAHVAIKDGKIAKVSEQPLDEAAAGKIIDAAGKWITPGFLEIHSHYDAEVVAAPALKESVRHGVTSIAIGSCSISMVNSAAEDCSDLFTRVEAVPREAVLPILFEKKQWTDARGYREFYDQHPLGPNVLSFIGHSDMRVAAMGIDRATSDVKPTEEEMQAMERMLEEALDAGCVGMSMMTTKLDKMDGERAWSQPLPSTFSTWWEFKRLFKILRRRGAILQGAPDAVKKVNVFGFLWQAHGLFRKPMKVTMLTALDLKSNPFLHLITRASGWLANKVLRGNYRWQTLPAPFTVHLEGLNVNAFEEFETGALLRDMKDESELYKKINEPEFRKEFKKHISEIFTVGLWHRDFSDGWITHCPDESLVGKNFKEIADTYGVEPVDAYFDLATKYKEQLRWKTNYSNARPHIMQKLIKSPSTHIGFGDSGAHIRSLAMYNFPLRMLKYVFDAQKAGAPFMTNAEAVHKLTGDLGSWFGLSAGYIREGDRADVVILNPEGVNDDVDQIHEAPMEGFGMDRLVKRNDDAIEATLVNGKVVYQKEGATADNFAHDFGSSTGYGRFLVNAEVSGLKMAEA